MAACNRAFTGIGDFAARVVELVCRDDGQDLVEYAFLAAFIGVAGYLVLPLIIGSAGEAYASWVSPETGAASLWDPPEPGGGS